MKTETEPGTENRKPRSLTAGPKSGSGGFMKLVFSLSAGRTGTAFLAELIARNIPAAEVHHERIGYDDFGFENPDLSHMLLFNSRGNVGEVQRFWDQKLRRILAGEAEVYVETAHALMKAGLVENSVRVCQGHDLHFVRLRRAAVPTLLSYERRGDFMNKSSQWLWYLDDQYPRSLVKSDAFRQFGLHGLALWYLLEVEFRAAYYKELYSTASGVHFHEADIDELNEEAAATALLDEIFGGELGGFVIIPGKTNASPETTPPEPETIRALEKLVTAAEKLDPLALAREYVSEGVDPFAPEENESG